MTRGVLNDRSSGWPWLWAHGGWRLGWLQWLLEVGAWLRAKELVISGSEVVGSSSGERCSGARSREQRQCDVEQSTVLAS
jgi:hypothetical protein